MEVFHDIGSKVVVTFGEIAVIIKLVKIPFDVITPVGRPFENVSHLNMNE